MSFENIYDVVPWPLLSWDLGIDPNTAGAQYSPRVFKSHLRLASAYRGCKYVVTVRDPVKTAVSFYNFLLRKEVPPVVAAGSLAKFVTDTSFVRGREGRASLWECYAEYAACLQHPSVLVLVYEDVVKDMPTAIRVLAKHMGVDASEELVAEAAAKSTKEFMVSQMDKIDEPYERAKALNRMAELSQVAPAAKVVLEPHSHVMDEAGKAFMANEWRKVMAPLGFEDYAAFAGAVRAANRERFGLVCGSLPADVLV